MKKAHLRRRLSSEGASTAPFRTSPKGCAGEAGARIAALHLDLFDQPALGARGHPTVARILLTLFRTENLLN